METKRHCLRCGKLGTRADSAGEEIWYCVDHGLIYRAPLPLPPPEPPAALSFSAPEPEREEEDDPAKKKEEDQENVPALSESGPP